MSQTENAANGRWSDSRAAGLFGVFWAACLAILAAHGRSVAEPLFLFLILGLALPGLALLVCRGLPARAPERPVAGEGALLAALVGALALFLAFKGQLLDLLLPSAPDPRLEESLDLLLKLAAFVALPLAAYALRARLSPAAIGLFGAPAETRKRSALAFVVLGAALAAVQFGLGRNARPLVDGSLAGHQTGLAFVLCFLWMSLEAGVVEETFFRAILQSRLAALAGSQAAGLFLGALVFGVAHAPGLWLRGAGAMEGMTEAPSLAVAIAYCVTTMGVAGLAFGVLWLRTRNWYLVVALHGLTDALSNTPRFIETWRL